jgi:transposase
LALKVQRKVSNGVAGLAAAGSSLDRPKIAAVPAPQRSTEAQRAKDAAQAQGPDGLINIPSPGVPPKLNSRHKAFLARIVEKGPIPAIHGVVRWRACDLIMRLYEEFGLSVSDDTIYRALKTLGFSHVSARPKAYKQNAEAMDAFKKTSPSVWRKSARSLHPAHR